MSAPDGFVRWRRLVRKTIRDAVKETREPPSLSLWVSHMASPRRCAHVPVGAAEDAGGVAVNVRESVREAMSAYVALGRALADAAPGSAGPILTTEFGLVVAGEGGRWEAWHAPIVAGRVGAWELDERAVWAQAVVPLLMGALRDVEALVRECESCHGEARAIVCPACGRGGVVVTGREEKP
jgi:hypothetical protein